MSDAITQGLIAALIVVAIMWPLMAYMQRRQAKKPHGKCVYCQKPLAMMGKYSRVCPKCKRTQPWVDADPQRGG